MKHKKAIKAAKILKKYCKERACENCVFNMTCSDYYWTVPLEWKVKWLKVRKARE